MSSERLNRTAVKDARLQDLLWERGTRPRGGCGGVPPSCPGRSPAEIPAGSGRGGPAGGGRLAGARGQLSRPGRARLRGRMEGGGPGAFPRLLVEGVGNRISSFFFFFLCSSLKVFSFNL